jgi:hypothetical protein
LLVTLTRREREREEDGFFESSSPSFSNLNPSFNSFVSFLFHNFNAKEEEQGVEDVEWTENNENKCEGKIEFFSLTKILKMTKVYGQSIRKVKICTVPMWNVVIKQSHKQLQK